MTDVPFCSEAGKTAFPVRAVIAWLNITDRHQRDLVYQFADMLLRELREPGSTPRPRQSPDELHPLAQALLAEFGMDLTQAIAYHLQQNLKRSGAFEADIARVEGNIARSIPFYDQTLVRVQLMTYIQRQWSHEHSYLPLMP